MAKARRIPGLAPETRFGDAAATAVSIRAGEVFEFADAALDLSDIEGVHAMRVATRRLRAALEVFAPCFPAKEHRSLLKEVKNLADALGERRDPDVAIEELEMVAAALALPDRPGVAGLVAELRDRAGGRAPRRSRRRWRTYVSLDWASGFRRSPRRPGREGPQGQGPGPRRDSFADNARRIAAVRLAELCDLAPKALDPAKPRKLHDMRIAAKRLRYALEISRPALGPGAADGRADGQGPAGAARRYPRLRRDAAAGCAGKRPGLRAADAGGPDETGRAQRPRPRARSWPPPPPTSIATAGWRRWHCTWRLGARSCSPASHATGHASRPASLRPRCWPRSASPTPATPTPTAAATP
ncbi:MAG: CHAD domain-containing protein [Thermoleophilaceae bacterium]